VCAGGDWNECSCTKMQMSAALASTAALTYLGGASTFFQHKSRWPYFQSSLFQRTSILLSCTIFTFARWWGLMCTCTLCTSDNPALLARWYVSPGDHLERTSAWWRGRQNANKADEGEAGFSVSRSQQSSISSRPQKPATLDQQTIIFSMTMMLARCNNNIYWIMAARRLD